MEAGEKMEPMVSLEVMELSELRDHLVSPDLSGLPELMVALAITDPLEDQ